MWKTCVSKFELRVKILIDNRGNILNKSILKKKVSFLLKNRSYCNMFMLVEDVFLKNLRCIASKKSIFFKLGSKIKSQIWSFLMLSGLQPFLIASSFLDVSIFQRHFFDTSSKFVVNDFRISFSKIRVRGDVVYWWC